MPRGVLHRALPGKAGSAHLAIGLPHVGVAWGDVVLAGLGEGAEAQGNLGALLTDRDPFALWERTADGRKRTSMQPGTCTLDDTPACNDFGKELFKALRHNDETNAPFGSTTGTAVLAEPLPMWLLREWRAAVKKVIKASEEVATKLKVKLKASAAKGIAALKATVLTQIHSTLALSEGYIHYVNVVVPAAVKEMLVVNQNPKALLSLKENIKLLSSPAHFTRGKLHAAVATEKYCCWVDP